jgi:RecA-family ATPase
MARGESAFPPVPVSNVKALPVPAVPVFKPTLASALPADRPEREFIVTGLIPKRELTLFAGQPDVGKGWLTLMLMCACGLGRAWLRRETRKCKSLAVFSEDPEDQLQIRRDAICKHFGSDPADLEEFVSWIDRGTDPVIFKGKGRFSSQWETYPLWQEIRRYIAEYGIELLILDNATTVGILYEDQHVKSFCRWLIGEAEDLGIAIILLHHPPASDSGGQKWYSGTANWARSVRNALVLQKIRREVDDERPWFEDDGRRVLLAPKNNYLPHDHPMRQRGLLLQWKDGVLQRTGA